MNVLSAREMFKLEEKQHGGKSYWSGEQAVRKYGKINKYVCYRIIERTKWIGTNSIYDVEILFQNEDNTFDYNVRGFWDEKEPTGGRIVGKHYTNAYEYVNNFINLLKACNNLSKEDIDCIYTDSHNKFNQ